MHIPNIHEVQCKWTMYNISIELWRHYLITTFFCVFIVCTHDKSSKNYARSTKYDTFVNIRMKKKIYIVVHIHSVSNRYELSKTKTIYHLDIRISLFTRMSHPTIIDYRGSFLFLILSMEHRT